MAGSVTHFEVNTPDNAKAAKFYGELFGWHTQAMGPDMGNYVIVDTHAGSGINGGLGLTESGTTSMVYIEVDDIPATFATVEGLGGARRDGPLEVPNVVALAYFTDPAGNVVGLSQDLSGGASPGVSPGSNPAVAWFELYGPDVEALCAFYRSAFGWEIHESDAGGYRYGELHPADAKGIGGGITGGTGRQPETIVWALVNDIEEYLERAESLGGKRLGDATQVNENLWVAKFVDDQGATFGLFRSTR